MKTQTYITKKTFVDDMKATHAEIQELLMSEGQEQYEHIKSLRKEKHQLHDHIHETNFHVYETNDVSTIYEDFTEDTSEVDAAFDSFISD